MSTTTGAADPTRQFTALLGAEHVLLGEEDRRFYGQDVHHAGEPPLAVLRPGSVEQLAGCVRIARGAGLAVLPLGGGMSYTQGFLTSVLQSV